MISSIAKLVYELPHELPNYLRLKTTELPKTRKQGNIRKILNLGGDITQRPVPPPEIKLRQQQSKNTENRYQTFLALSNFTGSLHFAPNALPRIVWANKFLVLTRRSLLQTLIFWHFLSYQSISPIFKENIKQVSCVKISNLTVLCKQYFACSV